MTSPKRATAAQRNVRPTAHEYVRDSIRDAILSGELRSGDRLTQTSVAEWFSVSTTPVREALRDLASEGLVRIDAHRGAVVNTLTPKDFEDIHDLCCLIEPYALRIADADRAQRALPALDELIEQMEDEIHPVRWTELNLKFHLALIGTSSSDYSVELLTRLYHRHGPYIAIDMQDRGQEHFKSANSQHRAMARAIRSQDFELASRLSLEHLTYTKTSTTAIARFSRVEEPSRPSASPKQHSELFHL